MSETKTWTDRIKAAALRGEFTPQDQRDAANWVTCACGETDPDIPRLNGTMEPEDRRLADYGESFFHYVITDSISEARRTLDLIQKRAAQVLKEASE